MAVIGCGPMGIRHARRLAAMRDVDLVAVCDRDDVAADTLGMELGVRSYYNHLWFLDAMDAAVVATPPTTHRVIAEELLEASIHVLVEKPMTTSEWDAERLVRIAETSGKVLQVGHIERFNPIFRRIADAIEAPFQIEAVRHNLIELREREVDVALDLMIHDIDLVLSIARSEVSGITASGNWDFVIAEVRFGDGSLAVLNANRKAATQSRFWTVNDQTHHLIGEHDALADELAHFVYCARQGSKPRVGAREGAAALRVALEIGRQIRDTE